jgi:hypothetical protein
MLSNDELVSYINNLWEVTLKSAGFVLHTPTFQDRVIQINDNQNIQNGGGVKKVDDKMYITPDDSPSYYDAATSALHFAFVGCGPNALLSAYLLSHILDKLGLDYQLNLIQPEKHAELNRNFMLGSSLSIFPVIHDTLSIFIPKKEVQKILSNVNTILQGNTCAQIQYEFLSLLSKNKKISVMLSNKSKGDKTFPTDFIRPHSVIFDCSGARHPLVKDHLKINIARWSGASRAWLNQCDFYGIGKFNINRQNIETQKHNPWDSDRRKLTQSQYDSGNDKMWVNYDMEFSNRMPAAIIEGHIHLMCGTGIIKTDVLVQKTIGLGQVWFLFELCVLLNKQYNIHIGDCLTKLLLSIVMNLHFYRTQTPHNDDLTLHTTDPTKYIKSSIYENPLGIKGMVKSINYCSKRDKLSLNTITITPIISDEDYDTR